MKFVIEPIGEDDCRIVDIDCRGLNGSEVRVVTFPSTVEADGKTWHVKEVGERCGFEHFGFKAWRRRPCYAERNGDMAKYASLRHLKTIIFEEGIERIECVMGSDDNAADNHASLTSVVLPSTLKYIGRSAFRNCVKLCNISIPEGLEEIDEEAFMGCAAMHMFPWPKSLKRVCLSAFASMLPPVGDFVIPDDIEEIKGDGRMPFVDRCVVSLQAWPAFYASRLVYYVHRLDIPEGVTALCNCFSKPHLMEVKLPSTLKEIGSHEFCYSRVLEHLSEIPASVEKIGDMAFACDGNLANKEVRLLNPNVKVGEGAFYSVQPNQMVKVVGDEATMHNVMKQPGALNGTLADEIILPEGIDTLDVCNCPELKELTVPDSVTRVVGLYHLRAAITASPAVWARICAKPWALRGYTPASGTLTLPEGVTTLAEGLFDESGLASIDLPQSLQSIGHMCFYKTNLRTLSVPAAVESMGESAFHDCGALQSVVFADGSRLEELPAECFRNCVALTTVDFGTGGRLRYVGSGAFSGTGVIELVFPHGMTTIARMAIEDCPRLESITFPATMREYDREGKTKSRKRKIVHNCRRLKYVTFLADDPATAVYPLKFGKVPLWYVPDHMVEHAKAYVAEHNADVKEILPLSALKPKAKSRAKDMGPLTQRVVLHTCGLSARYVFKVDAAHEHMLADASTCGILAVRYLRDKADQCLLYINNEPTYGHVGDELAVVNLSVPSSTYMFWHATPGSYRYEEAWCDSHPMLAQQCPSGSASNLIVEIGFNVVFDFMIGEKERFNVNRIKVMRDWSTELGNARFAFYYNDRLIHASGVVPIGVNGEFKMKITVSPSGTINAKPPSAQKGYIPEGYVSTELPLISSKIRQWQTSK